MVIPNFFIIFEQEINSIKIHDYFNSIKNVHAHAYIRVCVCGGVYIDMGAYYINTYLFCCFIHKNFKLMNCNLIT
jgi:hypothetical protein